MTMDYLAAGFLNKEIDVSTSINNESVLLARVY